MRALIFGVGGQDGAYLAKLLLDKGYQVFGTSRDAWAFRGQNLDSLNIKDQIQVLSMDLTDFRSVLKVVDNIRPNEIYNLAGQTSVRLSFDQPVEAMNSIGIGTLNTLEVIRFVDPSIRYFNASSSDCFGDTGDGAADENTPFRPCSPYGVAKTTAHYLEQNYREAYGLFACSGLLFNHESPLRPKIFVTQKIVSAASRIHTGSSERLELGSLSISRDWGWAPDYVDAMWRMLQLVEPEDFVISTGNTITLQQFVEKSFSYFKMDWKDNVDINDSLLRPSDIMMSRGNSEKARKILKWHPAKSVDDVIQVMCSSFEKY